MSGCPMHKSDWTEFKDAFLCLKQAVMQMSAKFASFPVSFDHILVYVAESAFVAKWRGDVLTHVLFPSQFYSGVCLEMNI